MFEKASKLKLRFESRKGQLSTEDLWDLPLKSSRGLSLDELAKSLNREIKESDTESFVDKTTSTNALLKLRFDIVIHVIEVKKKEEEVNEAKVANKRTKEKIMSIIAKKKDESLENSSIEDLEKMLSNI